VVRLTSGLRAHLRALCGPAEDAQHNVVKYGRDGRRRYAHGAYSTSGFRKQQRLRVSRHICRPPWLVAEISRNLVGPEKEAAD
jgi:hypothetical protein